MVSGDGQNRRLEESGKELFGENPQARRWAEQRLATALGSNGPALIAQIEHEQRSTTDPQQSKALQKLLTYLMPVACSNFRGIHCTVELLKSVPTSRLDLTSLSVWRP